MHGGHSIYRCRTTDQEAIVFYLNLDGIIGGFTKFLNVHDDYIGTFMTFFLYYIVVVDNVPHHFLCEIF